MDYTFTVNRAPTTKKNSQQIVYSKQRKRYFVLPSKNYLDYEEDAVEQIRLQAIAQGINEPIDYPCTVTCSFYMPTKRRVDLTNLLEAIDDVLVTAKVLADDNCQIIVAHDGSRVYHDKDRPRTEITIIPVTPLFT